MKTEMTPIQTVLFGFAIIFLILAFWVLTILRNGSNNVFPDVLDGQMEVQEAFAEAECDDR